MPQQDTKSITDSKASLEQRIVKANARIQEVEKHNTRLETLLEQQTMEAHSKKSSA